MRTARARRSSLNWTILAVVSLFCVAGCLRFSSLGNLPGINGDEADMGLEILRMLAGQPFALRSHTGQFFNPIFVSSETTIFRFFGHNFYLLRLPAGIFAVLGIGVLVYAYGKVFQDWKGAAVLGILTACFPGHMIYSRLAWDPTYLFFWTPLLLYAGMRLTKLTQWRYVWMLVLCIPLAIWTHATVGPFILALLLAIFWIKREEIARDFQKRFSRVMAKSIAADGAIIFCAGVGILILCAGIIWFIFADRAARISTLTPAAAWRALMIPGSLVAHLRLPGDLLSGYRPYRYVTGMPRSIRFEILSWVAEAIFFICAFRLTVSKNRVDRFLGLTAFVYLLLILLEAGALHLTMMGYERYLMALMVLMPLIIVRACLKVQWLILLAPVLLVQYWIYFEQPTLRCDYFLTQDRTYWTGLREPKTAAAELVRFYAHANPMNAQPVVYCSYYWLQRPMAFVLFGQIRVTSAWPGPFGVKAGDFVAGFAGEDFIQGAISDLKLAGRRFETYSITNQLGVEQVVVLHILK